ncbi:hypothetical protein N9N03_01145 [Chlamydiia bacterium]|nr:hypothetical protein [Chlamydiia bacterium]
MNIKTLQIPNLATLLYFTCLLFFHGLIVFQVFEINLMTSLLFILIYAIKQPLINRLNTNAKFIDLLRYSMTLTLMLMLGLVLDYLFNFTTSVYTHSIFIHILIIFISFCVVNFDESDFWNLIMLVLITAYIHITKSVPPTNFLLLVTLLIVKAIDNFKYNESNKVILGIIPLFAFVVSNYFSIPTYIAIASIFTITMVYFVTLYLLRDMISTSILPIAKDSKTAIVQGVDCFFTFSAYFIVLTIINQLNNIYLFDLIFTYFPINWLSYMVLSVVPNLLMDIDLPSSQDVSYSAILFGICVFPLFTLLFVTAYNEDREEIEYTSIAFTSNIHRNKTYLYVAFLVIFLNFLQVVPDWLSLIVMIGLFVGTLILHSSKKYANNTLLKDTMTLVSSTCAVMINAMLLSWWFFDRGINSNISYPKNTGYFPDQYLLIIWFFLCLSSTLWFVFQNQHRLFKYNLWLLTPLYGYTVFKIFENLSQLGDGTRTFIFLICIVAYFIIVGVVEHKMKKY